MSSNKNKIENLENRMSRIEGLIWYMAGILSLKGLNDVLPVVSGLLK